MEHELCSIPIEKHGEYLRNMFATEKDGGITVRMFVTTERDVADWEFQAIYDCYDTGVYEGLGLEVSEAPGDDNPAWEIAFPYIDGVERLAAKASGILNLHSRELCAVYDMIAGMEDDYNAL